MKALTKNLLEDIEYEKTIIKEYIPIFNEFKGENLIITDLFLKALIILTVIIR